MHRNNYRILAYQRPDIATVVIGQQASHFSCHPQQGPTSRRSLEGRTLRTDSRLVFFTHFHKLIWKFGATNRGVGCA